MMIQDLSPFYSNFALPFKEICADLALYGTKDHEIIKIEQKNGIAIPITASITAKLKNIKHFFQKSFHLNHDDKKEMSEQALNFFENKEIRLLITEQEENLFKHLQKKLAMTTDQQQRFKTLRRYSLIAHLEKKEKEIEANYQQSLEEIEQKKEESNEVLKNIYASTQKQLSLLSEKYRTDTELFTVQKKAELSQLEVQIQVKRLMLSNLSQEVEKMKKSSDLLFDTLITCQNEERIVIHSSSLPSIAFFKVALSGPMLKQELSDAEKEKHPQLNFYFNFEKHPRKTVHDLLEYVKHKDYLKSIQHKEEILALYHLADYLLFSDLQNDCLIQLEKKIKIEEYIELLIQYSFYDIQNPLIQFSIKKIVPHYQFLSAQFQLNFKFINPEFMNKMLNDYIHLISRLRKINQIQNNKGEIINLSSREECFETFGVYPGFRFRFQMQEGDRYTDLEEYWDKTGVICGKSQDSPVLWFQFDKFYFPTYISNIKNVTDVRRRFSVLPNMIG